jgi:hypothetical protein
MVKWLTHKNKQINQFSCCNTSSARIFTTTNVSIDPDFEPVTDLGGRSGREHGAESASLTTLIDQTGVRPRAPESSVTSAKG